MDEHILSPLRQTQSRRCQQIIACFRLVVSDIDGTITKSDLLGHLLPRVGFDWSHRGVTRLFTNIKANGYVFMFLSSRAIAQASATRDYLHTLNQDGETLPAGPVIISPDGLFPSLYRELVSSLACRMFPCFAKILGGCFVFSLLWLPL